MAAVRQTSPMSAITISVQSQPRDIESSLALARRLESSGFDALLAGDHPGTGASPWPALGAAAAVTTTLRLGTYMLQAGIRDPVHAAADAATLDVIAPGRVRLGLGAGHTFREWEMNGHARPSAADRAGRLVEFVDAVSGLLHGESVTVDGTYIRLDRAQLELLPQSHRVNLAVGGGNPAVLRAAASRAGTVALSGLGRTLPDGHSHEVRWSRAELDEQLAVIERESARAGTSPRVDALIQVVHETSDRAHALEQLSQQLPHASTDVLADTPFVLVGTRAEMAAQLERQAQEFGIRRYVIRESALETMEGVLPLLADD